MSPDENAVKDVYDNDEDDGEDLFDDNALMGCVRRVICVKYLLTSIPSDYAANETLDQYDAEGLDEEDQEEMTAEQRRKAEYIMNRRDRREKGGKKSSRGGRSRAPAFLDDEEGEEDMEGETMARMRTRTRHVYDERRDEDDMDGVEDVRAAQTPAT